MSLESFDISLMEKLKTVYPNVASTVDNDYLFRGSNLNPNLEIKLPLIALERIGMSLNNEDFNWQSTHRGRLFDWDKERGATLFERDIPILLTYQISVISDKRSEVDTIWRELLFYLKLSPLVEGKYIGTDIDLSYYINLEDIDMDIDPATFLQTGRMYRNILTVTIPQARILLSKERPTVETIPVRLILTDGKKEDTSELINTPPKP